MISLLEIENDLGPAACLLRVRYRISAVSSGFPLAGAYLTGATRQDGYLVCDHEGRIKTDPELPNQFVDCFCGLRFFHSLAQLQRSGPGNRPNMLYEFLAIHADPGIADGQGPCCNIRLQPNLILVAALNQSRVGQ